VQCQPFQHCLVKSPLVKTTILRSLCVDQKFSFAFMKVSVLSWWWYYLVDFLSRNQLVDYILMYIHTVSV